MTLGVDPKVTNKKNPKATKNWLKVTLPSFLSVFGLLLGYFFVTLGSIPRVTFELHFCYSSENSRRLWLSKIPCWKGFPANFDAAGKWFPDFPAAQNAIPTKVWALSGKENGCWKIGRACGNAAGFSPLRPPQLSWVLLNFEFFGVSGSARPLAPHKPRVLVRQGSCSVLLDASGVWRSSPRGLTTVLFSEKGSRGCFREGS